MPGHFFCVADLFRVANQPATVYFVECQYVSANFIAL
jgi:hypothetical protein